MSLPPAIGPINAPENPAVASRGAGSKFCSNSRIRLRAGLGLAEALSWYEGALGCELGKPWSLYVEDVSVAANHHVLATLENFLAVWQHDSWSISGST